MKDFIDLEGASGALYRFRLWPDGSRHLPMAGNYVLVREEPQGFSVVLVAESNDLSQARGSKPLPGGATHIFTRLNVSRAIRTAEHEDLSARYKAPSAQKRAG